MRIRTTVFVDFWNFQLNWNSRIERAKLDWHKLSSVLKRQAELSFKSFGLDGEVQIDQIKIYASYEPKNDADHKLQNWLESWLQRQPGFDVIIKEKTWREQEVHCRGCKVSISKCPNCQRPLGSASEKMIDSHIISDMLSLAWDDRYDLAVLISSDSDMVPGVMAVQNHGKKVINVTWVNNGFELARTSWANFEIDAIASDLSRENISYRVYP